MKGRRDGEKEEFEFKKEKIFGYFNAIICLIYPWF